jgi:hypothetical protein
MSNGPKSFKDLIKRTKLRTEQGQILKPVPRVQISDVELVRRNKLLAEMKSFANKLRCPLCGSQLDGSVSYKDAKLRCVSNPDEYFVYYPGRGLAQQERARVSNDYYIYQISYRLTGLDDNEVPQYYFTITEYDLSIHNATIREKSGKVLYSFAGVKVLPITENLNAENILKKLEVYQIFQ